MAEAAKLNEGAIASFWLNDDGWQVAWPAALAFAMLFHGFAFVVSTKTPPKQKSEPIVMAIAVPPPPVPEPEPEPEPEQEPPKPKPIEKPLATPPPNETPPPVEEPPPTPVTGVTADSVVAENASGVAVPVGNTTMGNPDLEEHVDPKDVQPIRAKVHFDERTYRTNAIALVAKQKRYPRRAQVMGIEGNVIVRVELDREGKLVGEPAIIGRGSGHDILDQEAIRMVKATAPYPDIVGDDVALPHRVIIPVQFRLADQ